MKTLLLQVKIVAVLGPWDYEWFNIFKFLNSAPALLSE